MMMDGAVMGNGFETLLLSLLYNSGTKRCNPA